MKYFIENLNFKSFKKASKELGRKFDNFFKAFLTFFVLTYKAIGAVHMGGGCRYQPTCSEYALQVLEQYNFISAIKLITKRLWSCRPGGNFGFDPVPLNKGSIHHE